MITLKQNAILEVCPSVAPIVAPPKFRTRTRSEITNLDPKIGAIRLEIAGVVLAP